MPNLNELLRLSELQDFGSQAEADAWFAEQEAAGRREADRDRQRRFRERRTAYADQGRRFVELVGRAPADEIELRVAEVAERDSITFSEALDRVLRDDPTAYREPDSDDDTHETTLREGNAAIDDAWLERAEALREDGEPLDDALRRAYREWDEDDPGAATIRAVQKVTSASASRRPSRPRLSAPLRWRTSCSPSLRSAANPASRYATRSTRSWRRRRALR